MSTKLISVKPLGNYETSQRPRNIKMITSDNLATITAADYINANDVQNLGGLFGTDVWEVIYSYDISTDSGTLGYFTTTISAGIVTLNIWENPGNVLLPVVDGNFANFNGTSGQIEDAGYSPSDAAKTKVVMANAATVVDHLMVSTDTAGTSGNKTGTAINDGNLQAGRSGVAGALVSFPSAATTGSLSLTAVANSGDYAGVISNAALGQATTWTLADAASATSKILQSAGALVSGNLVKASGTAGLMVDAGARIISNTTAVWGGGGTSNAFAATGLTSAAVGSAVIRTSTNAVSIVSALPGADTLTVTFSADPGANTTVDYIYTTAAQA